MQITEKHDCRSSGKDANERINTLLKSKNDTTQKKRRAFQMFLNDNNYNQTRPAVWFDARDYKHSTGLLSVCIRHLVT